MKKIFWTTIFWFVVVSILRAYARVFDANIAQTVAGLWRTPEQISTSLTGECAVCPSLTGDVEAIQATGAITTPVEAIKTELPVVQQQDTQLSDIQKQLDALNKKLDGQQASPIQTSKEIRLFLGNEKTPGAVLTVSGAVRVEMDK